MQLTEIITTKKKNIDSGDGEMSMNLTSERCNKRKEPSHPAYEKMLGAGLTTQRFEDDMKRNLEWSDDQNSTCTEVERMQGKGNRLIWLGVSHHVHMSCTKHHMDITIVIPAIFYLKT